MNQPEQPMGRKEIELLIDGVIHIADVEVNGDGTINFESVCKDNGIDNCDPTPVTPQIMDAVKEYLKDEIREARESYQYEMNSESRKGRHYQLTQ